MGPIVIKFLRRDTFKWERDTINLLGLDVRLIYHNAAPPVPASRRKMKLFYFFRSKVKEVKVQVGRRRVAVSIMYHARSDLNCRWRVLNHVKIFRAKLHKFIVMLLIGFSTGCVAPRSEFKRGPFECHLRVVCKNIKIIDKTVSYRLKMRQFHHF